MAKEKIYDIPGLHRQRSTTPTTPAAGTATAKYQIWVAPCACKVEVILQMFSAAITGADTDSRTLVFQNGGADGTGTTAISSKAYASGTNAVQNTPVDMSPAAGVAFAEGDVLTYADTLVGSGLAAVIPPSVVSIGFRPV